MHDAPEIFPQVLFGEIIIPSKALMRHNSQSSSLARHDHLFAPIDIL